MSQDASQDKKTRYKTPPSVCIFFSRFEGTREDKNQIFRTIDNTAEMDEANMDPAQYFARLVNNRRAGVKYSAWRPWRKE